MATLTADALTAGLSGLSLSSEAPATSKVVAFDALNYLGDFFDLPRASPKNGMITPFEALCEMEIRVQKFAAALEASGIQLLSVVDADTKTDEARRLWTTRRNREVTNEERSAILTSDVLLSEAFAQHGCRILRPLGADADDVLASLAANPAFASGVMSRDGDFFRYQGPQVLVYTGWKTAGPVSPSTESTEIRIELVPGDTSRYARFFPKIDVDLSLGERALAASGGVSGGISVLHAAGRDKYSTESKSRGRVERGCTSSSDKRMGNLHVIARPLRAAVYARHGVTEPVIEITPVWNNATQEVEWPEVSVTPDAALDYLLDDVAACERWLAVHETTTVEEEWPQGGRQAQWRSAERKFSRCALAAEIVSAASPPERPKGVLELLKEFPEYKAAKANVEASEIAFPLPKDPAAEDSSPPVHVGSCTDCRRSFGMTARHIAWYQEKDISLPTRCESCRAARKASGGGGRGRGRRDYGRWDHGGERHRRW